MPSPRVLFVTHTGALGGAELYLLDVAQHTPNAHVVLLEDGPLRKKLAAADIPVTVLPASKRILSVRRDAGLRSLLTALPALIGLIVRLARLARTADLVYLNSQKALIVGALAATLARRPSVWNVHDILTADHFSGVNRRLAILCANLFVDRVIANSHATRTAFVDSGGRTPSTVAYNGIDAAPFEAVTNAELDALRQTLGVGHAPLVGIFSRLASWKGQHVLLDALAHLPGVHALLVGDALFGEDEQYAHRLHQQCRTLGIADRVHFLGFRDDVPALMRLVDIVVHASTAPEPFGRVVIEGMLARRPVLATRAGGVLELIDDGRTGRLLPPGDHHALADAIAVLLDTPATATRMAHAGYDDAVTTFSRRAMLDEIQQVVRASLSPH